MKYSEYDNICLRLCKENRESCGQMRAGGIIKKNCSEDHAQPRTMIQQLRVPGKYTSAKLHSSLSFQHGQIQGVCV
jgi:hypothetical protein